MRSKLKPEGIFAAHYRLQRMAGEGAVSTVWLAEDTRNGSRAALKLISEKLLRGPEPLAGLKDVINRVRALEHPAVVTAQEVVLEDGRVGVITPWIEGANLAHVRLAQPRRCFDAPQIAELVLAVGEAMEAAHVLRIPHGALKPSNIFVSESGELFIADFGISAWLAEKATQQGGRVASAAATPYRTPNQMEGDAPVMADDIYAFGAIVFELLTGTPPFPKPAKKRDAERVAPSMAERRERDGIDGEPIPVVWEQTIAACLHDAPYARPRGFRTVLEMLGLVPPPDAQGAHDWVMLVGDPAREPTAATPPPRADEPESTPQPENAARAPEAAPAEELPVAHADPVGSAATVASASAEAARVAHGAPVRAAGAAARAVEPGAPPRRSGPRPVFPGRSPGGARYVGKGVGSPGLSGGGYTVGHSSRRAGTPWDVILLRFLLVLAIAATLGVGGWYAWQVMERQRVVVELENDIASLPTRASAEEQAAIEARIAAAERIMSPRQHRAIVERWRVRERAMTPAAAVATATPAPAGESETASPPPEMPADTAESDTAAATSDAPGAETAGAAPPIVIDDAPVESAPAAVDTAPANESAAAAADAPDASANEPVDQTAGPGAVVAEPIPSAPLEESPPPPAFGAIAVETVPTGAEVQIGDGPVQRSPFELSELPAGTHAVRAQFYGYAPYEGAVEIAANETKALKLVLEPLIGVLRLESASLESNYELTDLGGLEPVRRGATPAVLHLPPGRYRVTFTRDGHPPQTRELEVAANSTAFGAGDFREGAISVTAEGDGRPLVSVDGVPRGAAPLQQLALPVGEHEVRIEFADGRVETRNITVTEGRTEEITVAAAQAPAAPSAGDARPDAAPTDAELAARVIGAPDAARDAAPATGAGAGAGAAEAAARATAAPGDARAAPSRPSAGDAAASVQPTPAEPVDYDRVFELREVNVRPQLIERVEPKPPRGFWRPKSGRVDLRIVVDRNGLVASAEPISTTDNSLTDLSLQAVRLWRFSPAKKDGRPVAVRVIVPLVFRTK